MASNASMPNWKQMAEKLGASVCVLENLLVASQGETKTRAKFERSVALQFPEDFFQEPQEAAHHQLSSVASEMGKNVNVVIFPTAKPINIVKQSDSAPEVLPESQLKLHQSILNFKQFNCSLKPLLAMLEFVLQDASGVNSVVAHMHPLIPRFFSISLSLLLPCIVGI
jgi:hypothetical protein